MSGEATLQAASWLLYRLDGLQWPSYPMPMPSHASGTAAAASAAATAAVLLLLLFFFCCRCCSAAATAVLFCCCCCFSVAAAAFMFCCCCYCCYYYCCCCLGKELTPKPWHPHRMAPLKEQGYNYQLLEVSSNMTIGASADHPQHPVDVTIPYLNMRVGRGGGGKVRV